MTKIKVLAISGKKQSGKDTNCNYIVGLFLKALGTIQDFSINEKGHLMVTDILGNTEYEGRLDLENKHPEFIKFAEEHIWPFVKVYSFAEDIKETCINVFGLSREQCYGTDEQKNSLTHLKWSKIPTCHHYFLEEDLPEEDRMTAREVMKYVGTELFREMDDDVWVSGTIRKIKEDKPCLIAIIKDLRFINELEGVLDLNEDLEGKVLRLTRSTSQDDHGSETDLDDETRFTHVINNDNLSIEETNVLVNKFLSNEKWLPFEVPAMED